MKVTDNHAISEPLRQLADRVLNEYSGLGAGTGRSIGVTSLIQPFQLILLQREHDFEIERDLSNLTELLLGQLLAVGLKEGGLTDIMPLRATVEDHNGAPWLIGGTPDYVRVEQTTLGPESPILVQDYKVSKVRAVRDGGNAEWKKQQELYNLLLALNGYDGPYKNELVVLLKDWNWHMVGKKKDYPERPLVRIQLTLPSVDETLVWVKERLTRLDQARLTRDVSCSDEETWQGRRCARWCPVVEFCGQGQRISSGPESDIDP